MLLRVFSPKLVLAMAIAGCFGIFGSASAQTIPAPADAGRVPRSLEEKFPARLAPEEVPAITPVSPETTLPDAVKGVRFKLKEVRIEGATVFPPEQLKSLYSRHLGKTLSLEAIWQLAGKITERYHRAGYFLSRAYVPEQAIKNGVIVVRVVEGYVGAVKLDHPLVKQSVVQKMMGRLMARKPLQTKDLESFLLSINDLPGASFRGVLSQTEEKNAPEGAVTLLLEAASKERRASITFDNFGSRFLGPHEVSGVYETSLLPLQKTTVSGLSSVPTKEMKYVAASHTVAVAPDVTAQLHADIALTKPGFTLKPLDVDSKSMAVGADVSYQVIRSRTENLAVNGGIRGRNTDSEILGATTTRDRVRAVHVGAVYDTADKWRGYNVVNTKITQGLPALGASSAGDINLSRAEAEPDFTKMEVTVSRLQQLTSSWYAYSAASGQVASGPLYSSEEFGYGGQTFGRAYDNSEITGDHGISGSIELRYAYWSTLEPIGFTPYGFYDAGMVWNEDGAPDSAYGSSFGLGMRFFIEPYDVSGNLMVAIPLSRPAGSPIYGVSNEGPRAGLQLSKEF